MRVAYLLPPLRQPNGWRNHARGFITAIRKYVEPVLFVAEEDCEAAQLFFPGYQVISLPIIQYPAFGTNLFSKLIPSLKMISLTRHYPEVDLVHSLETYPAGLVGYWLASKLRKPHILTAHGTYGILPYKSLPDRVLYRWVLKHARALCPVSPHTADLIRRYFGSALANIYVKPILNGNDYYQKISRQEVMLRQPPAIPTILSVGAVKPRKGHHISLQVFARLKERLPSARYWIIGPIDKDQYYQELRQFITSHHLEDVEFLGTVPDEDMNHYYREASVFLLTAQQIGLHFEGFGLVCLEAGAFGLPVVGTRTGGIPAAIRDGETGFVVDPDDIEGLAAALERLLINPDLARDMGLANRTWAETLTWDRYAHEQYQVYREVMA